MNKLKRLFISSSVALSFIPGLAALKGGVGIPPGDNALFAGSLEALGAAIMLLIWSQRETIRLRTAKWRSGIVLSSLALFIFSLGAYLWMYRLCIITNTGSNLWQVGTVTFPLWITGPAAESISHYGGRQAALNALGPAYWYQTISQMPGSSFALATTTSLLLLAYQAIVNSLVVSFAILGLS